MSEPMLSASSQSSCDKFGSVAESAGSSFISRVFGWLVENPKIPVKKAFYCKIFPDEIIADYSTSCPLVLRHLLIYVHHLLLDFTRNRRSICQIQKLIYKLRMGRAIVKIAIIFLYLELVELPIPLDLLLLCE